jgi:hypothetical protein
VIPGMVPIKTREGQAELVARQRAVSQRHRTVLFLVDGKRNAETVRAMALAAGVPPACFDDLLEIGLIMLVEPTLSIAIETPLAEDVAPLQVDLPLSGSAQVDGALLPLDSALPPSRSLFSESTAMDSSLIPEAWLQTDGPSTAGGRNDAAFMEARLILARAVRAEAPLAGSLTLLRLRRARTRADLMGLLEEVEARINKPHRLLAATRTMQRVRMLLREGSFDASPGFG